MYWKLNSVNHTYTLKKVNITYFLKVDCVYAFILVQAGVHARTNIKLSTLLCKVQCLALNGRKGAI